MVHRGSCWERMNEAMLKKHKSAGRPIYYDFWRYIAGHFKFFHLYSDESLGGEFLDKYNDWTFLSKLKAK